MANGYRPVDRDQQFLLPPDMREWLPADHPVWLVISLVARLDTRAAHASRRTGGVGRAGYDPDMMLTLLIWAWAQGQRSSRRIERLCSEDVAFRIICAGDAPDHVTISRFRAGLDTAVQDLFKKVLVLCAELGMGRLGVVALDGVKIASNASMTANRSARALGELAAAEAARTASAEHAAADRDDDDLFGPGGRADQVPADVVDPSSRAARIAAAIEQTTAGQAKQDIKLRRVTLARIARAQSRLDAARAAQQAVVDDYQARAQALGRRPPGNPVTAVEQRSTVIEAAKVLANLQRRYAAQAPAPHVIANLTDPQSRLQPLRGGGWVQGYNCQAMTSSDGVIIAVGVSNNPVDAVAFQPMMDTGVDAARLITTHHPEASHPVTSPGLGPHSPIGIILADAGYLSRHNLTTPGPDRLIAVGKARALETAAREQPASGPAPTDVTDPVAAMAHRLRTPTGIATYRQRSHIAETPFGHAKHNLGFRRFTGRGLSRATTEWTFNALVHNLMKTITAARPAAT